LWENNSVELDRFAGGQETRTKGEHASMARLKREQVFEQYSHFLDHEPEDLELLILKGHIAIEDGLKYLLATKLGAIDPLLFVNDIRILSFELLLKTGNEVSRAERLKREHLRQLLAGQ
jgi:hypothetical protein